MNILSVDGVSKRFGERLVFQNVSFGLAAGEKVALVAKNGMGKSTLLNILSGTDSSDTGEVVYRSGIRKSFLLQDIGFDPHVTALEHCFTADSPSVSTYSEYMRALDSGDVPQDLLDRMDDLDAWNVEVSARKYLEVLLPGMHEARMGSLSGGQLKRVELARILLEEPDFLVLDEPTNHLDVDMIEWLEAFLIKFSGTLLLVTHDRYFLEVVCDRIVELTQNSVYDYQGNFSYYLEKRQERMDVEDKEVEKARKLAKSELEWIRRMPKARGTKQKARVKAFEVTSEIASRRREEGEVTFEVNPPRLGTKVIEFHKVGLTRGDKQLISSFSRNVKRTDKIGVLGPNGCGKSSLFQLIEGSLEPTSGKIVIGETVEMGHYKQKGLQVDPSKRLIEVIKDIAEFIPLKKGRKLTAAQLLERFLFPRSVHYQRIDKFSGGEQKRAYLLTVLMRNPNVLLLDEPTNDLDIYTLEVLEQFLQDFEGVVITISHDRYFLDKICDQTLVFGPGGEIKEVVGSYSDAREFMLGQAAQEKKEKEPSKPVEPKKQPKQKEKLSYNEQREFEMIDKELPGLEERQQEILDLLAGGEVEDPDALSKELADLSNEIQEKTERWMELADRA